MEPPTLRPTGEPGPAQGPRPPAGSAAPTAIGNYRILGELGRGGMGVVYLARDARLQRDVAIKLLPDDLDRDPVARERFLGEARTLAALDHPNIAIIHSLEESAGRHFLTMERIEGRSLGERLREGPLPLDQSLAVARQVARALEVAHAKGVVHRDLKPSNVMLREDGTAKVLDFGLALRLDRPAGVAGAAAEAEVSGTPGYMSPEQVRGDAVDPRSDVWALGCLVHECLAGRPLVAGGTQYEKLAATLALDVPAAVAGPWPSGALPARMSHWLERSLAGSPAERFASMHEARLVLEEEIAERTLPRGPAEQDVRGARPRAPGHVPLRLTRFVGRAREVEAASRLLREHRLVTLTGAGGCGKSRLSLELATRLPAAHSDGAWFVELASLADSARLAASVNTTLGVPHDAAADATGALLSFLGEKRLLLILDNCEHVLDACADLVARVLASCPHVRLLATSREALRVEGEAVFVLPPLGLPAAPPSRAPGSVAGPPAVPASAGAARTGGAPTVEESDAVRLFVDRARAAFPAFELDAGNRAAVAGICRKLDGIPLAIELAAARVRVLSAPKILELLDDRFRLLTGGARTSQPHQQTLRALIDWSYDRLEPREQAVLRRLSVFRGGWTLEGAEAVVTGGDVASWDALDLFTRLVEKSLVVRDLADAGSSMARYSLLESIREYAREKLLQVPGEAAESVQRHREYVVALAVEGFDGLRGPDEPQWTVRLDDAVHDVRAVLAALAADPAGADAELRLAGAYGLHWMKRGMWAEGREALERALGRPDADRASAPYGQALVALGNLDFRTGELDRAHERYDAALTVLRVAGTETQLASVTMNLGNIAWSKGDTARAEEWYETALAHYRRAGSTAGVAGCLNNIAAIAISREEFDRVEALQAEALAIFESLGIADNICLSLFQLGIAALTRAEYDLAHERLERALALARAADNRWNIMAALDNLAGLEIHRARLEAARAPLAECLVRLRDMRDPLIGVSALESAAAVLHAADPAAAAALLAAAEAERGRHQMQGLSYERDRLRRIVAGVRAALGDGPFARASAEGAALTLVQALARAEALLGVPAAE